MCEDVSISIICSSEKLKITQMNNDRELYELWFFDDSVKNQESKEHLLKCSVWIVRIYIMCNCVNVYSHIPRCNLANIYSSVAQLCLTPCNPMDCSTPGFPVHHQLPGPAQTHVHWVGDAIQPSHPLLSPSSAFTLSHIYICIEKRLHDRHQIC